MILWIAVAIGGAIGSLLRYACGLAVAGLGRDFPLATLMVNVVGCFAIGCWWAYLSRPAAGITES